MKKYHIHGFFIGISIGLPGRLDRSIPYAITKTSLRLVNDFSRINDATTTLPLGF